MGDLKKCWYPFVKTEMHDALGWLFIREEYQSLLTHKTEVSWRIVRNQEVSLSDVYIREYNADGTICRYISLAFFMMAVITGNYSLSENVERDVECMRKACQDFVAQTVDQSNWASRLMTHLRSAR